MVKYSRLSFCDDSDCKFEIPSIAGFTQSHVSGIERQSDIQHIIPNIPDVEEIDNNENRR